MIKLYGFGAAFNVGDPSPFVLKLMAFMKLANIPYDYIGDSANLQKAPRGKLPFIEDKGNIIPDSEAIICYLQQHHGADIDSHLSAEDKARAYLINRSLDEDFYWTLVYSRWMEEDTWHILKAALFDGMPFPLNKIIPIVARKKVTKNLYHQGLGRRDKEEVYTLASNTLNGLSTLLGDKPFFMGDQPCSLDVVAYSHLAQLVCPDFSNRLNKLCGDHKNLVDFVENFDKAIMS